MLAEGPASTPKLILSVGRDILDVVFEPSINVPVEIVVNLGMGRATNALMYALTVKRALTGGFQATFRGTCVPRLEPQKVSSRAVEALDWAQRT